MAPNFGGTAPQIMGPRLSNGKTFRSRGKVSRRSADGAQRSRSEKNISRKTYDRPELTFRVAEETDKQYRTQGAICSENEYLNVRLGRQNVNNRFSNVIRFQYLFIQNNNNNNNNSNTVTMNESVM